MRRLPSWGRIPSNAEMWSSEAVTSTPAQQIEEMAQARPMVRSAPGDRARFTIAVHQARRTMSWMTANSPLMGMELARAARVPARTLTATGTTYGARRGNPLVLAHSAVISRVSRTRRSTGDVLPGPAGGSKGWHTTVNDRTPMAKPSFMRRRGRPAPPVRGVSNPTDNAVGASLVTAGHPARQHRKGTQPCYGSHKSVGGQDRERSVDPPIVELVDRRRRRI